MNNARRKELARAVELLSSAMEILSACAAEEREAFDALSDSLQDGPRGEAIGEAADALEDAEGSLGDVIATIEGVTL